MCLSLRVILIRISLDASIIKHPYLLQLGLNVRLYLKKDCKVRDNYKIQWSEQKGAKVEVGSHS